MDSRSPRGTLFLSKKRLLTIYLWSVWLRDTCNNFLKGYLSAMNQTHEDLKFEIENNCLIEETVTRGRYKRKQRGQLQPCAFSRV